MLILLRTQVDRTAKTPVTARRTRDGGLCGFCSAAERVPTGSPKPDVAPPCGSVAGTPSTEEGHLRAISDREQSRKRRSSRLWICQGIKMQKK